MKISKNALEKIKNTLENENEFYIFLDSYQNKNYTCINSASTIQKPKYNSSQIFKHTSDTIYSMPYKKTESTDDYSVLQNLYKSLHLPDISGVVKDRFNKENTTTFTALHDYLFDYNGGIRVVNKNGTYITSLVFDMYNDGKPYHTVQASLAYSDCLEKALMLSMQNLNLYELDSERVLVEYDLNRVIPNESPLYPTAEKRLKKLQHDINTIKKQKYFTNLIPEKSFEM